MKGKSNSRENQYSPVIKKTFSSALGQFLENAVPQLSGWIIRDKVVTGIVKLVEEFYPKHTHLRMGQVMWPAVDVKETSGYGKSIEKTKLKPVFVDLINDHDIQEYISGKKAKDIKKNASVRVFKQAKEQGGVLTYSDVASMFKLSPGTIGKYVREWESQNDELVPRRGTVHDMGRSLTHKKSICYKTIVEGKSLEQVVRETNHSPEAITRYVKDCKRVWTCLKAGLSMQATSFTIRISDQLVYEYKNLIDEYKSLNSNNGDEFDVPF